MWYSDVIVLSEIHFASMELQNLGTDSKFVQYGGMYVLFLQSGDRRKRDRWRRELVTGVFGAAAAPPITGIYVYLLSLTCVLFTVSLTYNTDSSTWRGK